MKGFIEVTNGKVGSKQLINISRIRGVSGRDGDDIEEVNGAVAFDDGVIGTRESYDELKELIRIASN